MPFLLECFLTLPRHSPTPAKAGCCKWMWYLPWSSPTSCLGIPDPSVHSRLPLHYSAVLWHSQGAQAPSSCDLPSPDVWANDPLCLGSISPEYFVITTQCRLSQKLHTRIWGKDSINHCRETGNCFKIWSKAGPQSDFYCTKTILAAELKITEP